MLPLSLNARVPFEEALHSPTAILPRWRCDGRDSPRTGLPLLKESGHKDASAPSPVSRSPISDLPYSLLRAPCSLKPPPTITPRLLTPDSCPLSPRETRARRSNGPVSGPPSPSLCSPCSLWLPLLQNPLQHKTFCPIRKWGQLNGAVKRDRSNIERDVDAEGHLNGSGGCATRDHELPLKDMRRPRPRLRSPISDPCSLLPVPRSPLPAPPVLSTPTPAAR